ncbi:MAG: hypothetical protein ABL921_21840 [Pirellula sp.]
MHKQISNWFALVLLTTGLGMIVGYLFTPSVRQFVSFDKSKIEFPIIGWNEFGTQPLRISNVSGAKIQFVASAECHCTNVVPAKGSLDLGESIELQVHYRPKFQADESISIERSMVRFELYDGKNAVLQMIPISAEVLKPFIMDQSQLTVAQFGIKPVEFQWTLTTMEDVEKLDVVQPANFMSRLETSKPEASSQKITIRGKTRPRDEIDKPIGDNQLAGTTRSGREFRVTLPTRVQFNEAFRLSPDTLRMQAGQSTLLELKRLDPANHYCKIIKVESEIEEIHVTQVHDGQWELKADSSSASSGYAKVQVSTQELKSSKSVVSMQYVPILLVE